jgi:hypothetical protein
MDATTYAGVAGTTLSVTNSAGFQTDLVWVKNRTNTFNNSLFDSVRGTNRNLYSNSTSAEVLVDPNGWVSAFNSNGFTVTDGGTSGGNVKANSSNYVAWQWKAGSITTNTSGSITSTISTNATAGFSIVTYTGTGANATVGHGLGVAPKMIITRYRGSESWSVYHTSLGGTKTLYLNLTNAANTTSLAWNNTDPTSTVFSLGSAGTTNTSGGSGMVAYCWAEIAGFSKFGSYTGNGSADGPFVYTGFRPKFILWKSSTDGARNWSVFDSSRNTYNVTNSYLLPNLSNAEGTSDACDFLSNGFKWRSTDAGSNGSGQTFIYMAFAENPFKNSNAR